MSIVDNRSCRRATANGTFALWIMLSLSSLCVGEWNAQDAKVEYVSKTVGHKVCVHESLLKDSKRSKELAIRISFPEGQATYPLIIWSHGMYGSKDNYQPLVEYWTSRGYVVIQPTHSDSLSLMKAQERRQLLREFNLDKTEDWMNRPRDVQFTLDSLATIEQEFPDLAGKIDSKRIGIGDHAQAGNKTLVWILDAYHNFGGISGSPPLLNRLIGGQGGGKNDLHLKLVQLSTLVFWDAFLKDDQEALAYLSENKLSDYGQTYLKMERK